MSEKQIKKYQKTIRRNQNKLIQEFMQSVKNDKFFNRLKIAFSIIFKRG